MTRRRLKKESSLKRRLLYVTFPVLGLAAILVSTIGFWGNNYFSKVESEEVKASSSRHAKVAETSSAPKQSTSKSDSQPSSSARTSETTTEETPLVTEIDTAYLSTDELATSVQTAETVETTDYYHAQTATYTPVQTTPQYVSSSGHVLANGNTAGETGSYAAAQMAAATGVDQATWEYIIARESNGQVDAQNASGASGLFQTMPGWGSTATVQDQINAAIRAYNAQGLAAWGY